MAKKMHAKDRREMQEAQRRERYIRLYQISGTQKHEQEAQRRERYIRPAAVEKAKPKSRKPQKKSSAKMAGVKSAFILSENELLMTSFGKGNDAVLEKKIMGTEVENLNNPPSYSASMNNESITIESNRASGSVDNPLHTKQAERETKRAPGENLIGTKDKLEDRFFGRSFNDNIHIQLIYNVLDIEKILAQHINNIIYVVNNLPRVDIGEIDLIGYIHPDNTYDDFMSRDDIKGIVEQRELFKKIISAPQRLYLGDALYNTKLGKGKKEGEKDYKRYYYELYLLGIMRQTLFHGNPSQQISMYQLEEKYDYKFANENNGNRNIARGEARKTLDAIYNARINELNLNFLQKATKNLAVLFDVYNANSAEEKGEIVREYYNFEVKKEYKYLGFSLKKLREIIVKREKIRENCSQTMWGKFVKYFDFVAQRFYQGHQDLADRFVESLRASDEESKEKLYNEHADYLWKGIKGIVINSVMPKLVPDVFKRIEKDADVSIEMLKEVAIGTNAHYFSKLIYMTTLFLNGKEINDLVTQLINKFDNISAFNYVLYEQKLPSKYKEGYEMFADSREISLELRDILNFARMQKESPSAKKALYIEAANVLGFSASEKELEQYVELILTKKEETRRVLLNQVRQSSLPIPKEGFRNFIANNVVESSKFKYLVRYTDPGKVSVVAHNDAVIAFVLKQMPDEQIKRYYISCIGQENASSDCMRDTLRHEIKGLDFCKYRNVNQRGNAERDEEKRKAQSIIGLYLAVIYLVVKNLVNINARYTLAFHCLERDFSLLKKKSKLEDDYKVMAKEAIQDGRLNARASKYIEKNMENTDNQAIRYYRNNVAHLNVLRVFPRYVNDVKHIDSYYALYQYLTQKTLMDSFEREGYHHEKTEEYFAAVKKYGTYCKDLVKALNVPFGYNLPRYKNLSIEELFDREGAFYKGTGDETEVKQMRENVSHLGPAE